jgi:hypothetical protein
MLPHCIESHESDPPPYMLRFVELKGVSHWHQRAYNILELAILPHAIVLSSEKFIFAF